METEIKNLVAKLGPTNPEAFPIPIYYINLNQSVARRQFMRQQLKGVPNVHRVEAVDGTKIYPKFGTSTLKLVGGILAQCAAQTPLPKLGCTLSHLKAMERVEQDETCDWVLVCEDDVLFQLSSCWPPHILTRLMKQGDKQGAGIIQLYWGPRSFAPETKYGTEYNLKHMDKLVCWGTVAYLISKKGRTDILSYTGFPCERAPINLEDPGDTLLQGIADQFLFALTPTFICGKPLLTFDCSHGSILGQGPVVPSCMKNQRAILKLYV